MMIFKNHLLLEIMAKIQALAKINISQLMNRLAGTSGKLRHHYHDISITEF